MFKVANRSIGKGYKPFIIAEVMAAAERRLCKLFEQSSELRIESSHSSDAVSYDTLLTKIARDFPTRIQPSSRRVSITRTILWNAACLLGSFSE